MEIAEAHQLSETGHVRGGYSLDPVISWTEAYTIGFVYGFGRKQRKMEGGTEKGLIECSVCTYRGGYKSGLFN